MNKENFNRGSGFCQCLFYMLKEVMWMANKIFNTRVKNKRDTEANWKRKNPVLLDGEIIIVTTTSGDTRFKVGDGKKTYNQLPFQDQKTRDLIPSVDSSLSSTSTNPVQNKIIKSELDKKAERDVVNTTTNGLMSVADKKKLDGIADGANKITVDTSLSSTSTNPVQNKIIKSELDTKFNKSGGTINGSVWVNSDSNESVAISAGRVVADDWVNATSGVTIGKGSSAGAFVSLRCDRSSDTTESLKIFKDLYVEDGGLAHVTIADPIDSDHATTKNYVDTGLSGKLDKTGGTLTGNLKVTGALFSGDGLSFGTGENIHFTKAADDAGKLAHGAAGVDDTVPLARLKVASPTEDDDAATKAYVDGRAAGTGAVRYDAAQTLTGAQKLQARKNVDAAGVVMPQFQGFLTLTPANETLGAGVGLSPTRDGNNFALDISDVNEGTPTKLTGVKTPTDADTNAAATVEYVKAAVPTALKNPNALTIKIGSTTVTYDGSAAKTVEIADGSEVSY